MIQLLVLQSTQFCNIDCSYCYLPGREIKNTMSPFVLERIASEIVGGESFNDDSLVLWHAGEPLWLGVEWYEEARYTLSRGRSKPVRMQFQSNAMLLDDAWVSFLRQPRVGIGVSLDGPQWLHDAHRRDRANRGSFERAMQGVARLQKAGVGFSVIVTVTDKSLDHPDEIFDFFAAIGPQKLGFNIEEAEGANAQSSMYRAELEERVEAFFRRIVERNLAKDRPLRLRELESVLVSLKLDPGRFGSSQETQLGRIVSVDATGEVALFSPELLTTHNAHGRREIVGNLMSQTFIEILNGAEARSREKIIGDGVEKCRTECSYFSYCGGGAPANKMFEHGRYDVTETWFCRMSKQASVRGILTAIGQAGAVANCYKSQPEGEKAHV